MKSASILIKPASGLCNLNCKYCFYKDEMSNRKTNSYGFINKTTTSNILDKFLNIKDLTNLTIAFQGGEPTLIGLDYYKEFVKLAKEKNINNVNIYYTIQTNATLLNEEFAKFFSENNFLVGVSLDGTKNTNDLYRIDNNNKPVYDSILNGINLLKKYNVSFNILTVITKDVSKNINTIYKFYKDNNFKYTQYIPVLNKFNNSMCSYSLTPHDYTIFLQKLFDLYYKDIINNNYVYNRYFENLICLILNINPEDCSLNGHCSIQFVIEANGNVYPCDFYCLDKYLLGNINTNTVEELLKEKAIDFIKESSNLNSKCTTCKYFKLCRSGCKRYKDGINRNYYCSSFINFFDMNLDRLIELSRILPQIKRNV